MHIFKKTVSLFCFLLIQVIVSSQVILPVYPDSIFSTYYHQRVSLFRSLPQTKNDIIFLGNSITDGGEWSELFANGRIKNRGISGDITAGVLHRIDEIANRKPEKVFLLIGTNDLARNMAPDSVVKNILLMVAYLRQQTPATRLHVQSILPVNNAYKMFSGHTSKAAQIKQVNAQLKDSALSNRYTYIDLHSAFSNEEGKLKENLSNDGLHLKGEAYLLWKHIVYPYINDLGRKPSLIPLPQSLNWFDKYFPLYNCKTIVVKDASLQKEAQKLQELFQEKGLNVAIADKVEKDLPHIEIRIGKVSSPQLDEEAYQLNVLPEKLELIANTAHGIFNGIQTLSQLMRDGVMIPSCEIIDWPAYSWRGYMIDVGRNYQSVKLLKQQIEVLAKYKMNIFHFHPTEDIAWRIAIKQYPQLTAPEHMLRNKGKYYSEAEIKELINFCKEKYITFVPEIDMPGHSAAFKRAMKTDMQTDSGIAIIKNILKEFCETYDVPYLHIGADEVKITNKNFVPEVTAYIQSLGKKVIGWEPGGNFTNSTIRQLWMDDVGHLSAGSDIQYIDSRHLYLNHMDPLETVVTIFNRQIGDKQKEDKNMKGGTLCMWPDRRVENEKDVLQMNAVYPGIVAFAERSWAGGGSKGWKAVISKETGTDFFKFENRLLDHKQQYFSSLPFPYTRQTFMQWKFYGPYQNNGDLAKKFEPEQNGFDENLFGPQADKIKPAIEGFGGTIILRHWWAPLIKGMIDDPKENTTWYATTKVWNHVDKIQNFWIGFNNLSRSPATDSHPAGEWDNKQSAVWVNGKLIEPPVWKRGGQKGNSEIPLIDEGYAYREPTKIFLKKGWNDVLIKVPVASFKGKDWQNPVKWMFTFVPVSDAVEN